MHLHIEPCLNFHIEVASVYVASLAIPPKPSNLAMIGTIKNVKAQLNIKPPF